MKQPIPAILFGAAAASPGNGKIYIFGGYVTGNLTLEYDPVEDSWRSRRPMPTPRHGHAVVALGRKVYVLGGSGPSDALEIYDPTTDTWSRGARMPTARIFLAAAEMNGKIFAIGGSPDCCGDSRTDAVEIYDPVSDSWTTGAPLPIAQQTSAAQGVNGNVYVLGGFIPGSGAQGTTFEYDPTTSSWSAKAPVPTARDQAPAVLVDGLVYLLGGSVDCHCQALGKTERYTPSGSPLVTCTKIGPASVLAGETVTYAITVSNEGTAAAARVMLTNPTPAGLTFVPGGGLCGSGFPCELGTLNVDEKRQVEVKFRVPASCIARNPIRNVASVSAEGVGSIDCKSQPARTTVRVPPTVDCCELAITKTDGRETAIPGETLFHEIVVKNQGRVDVPEATVEDIFPAELTQVLWCRDPDAGAPCNPNREGNLEETIPLPVGRSTTYRARGIVDLEFTGTLTNTASVMAPGCKGVSATDGTVIEFTGIKAFCASIDGQFVEGGTITYTFLLLNGGPSAQADNPGDELTATLPATLTLVSAEADSGIASTLGNTAIWNGTIPVGGMVTITITATINAGTAGMTICNQAVIAFDADGDGSNESGGLSDEPGEPGPTDPCCFRVFLDFEIPALSAASLALLALLLACLALTRLRALGAR